MIAELQRLSDAPPGHPRADQVQAVHAAEARARQRLRLPPYTIHWVHAPGQRIAGLTRYPTLTTAAMWIRDDLTPMACYRVMLHELQHVADCSIITEISEAESERRAEAFVAMALQPRDVGGGAMMTRRELDAERKARVAQYVSAGMSELAAWDAVLEDEDRQAPDPRKVHTSTNGRLGPLPGRVCICGCRMVASGRLLRCWGCGRMRLTA